MEIANPQPVIVTEPLEDPFRRETPAPETPATPVEVPDEELVPA
jgi:hypothetical protein